MASNINVNIGDDTLADIFIEPDDLLTIIIRYGLYFGAIFQVICIAAVIFIKDNSKNVSNDSDTESSELSPQLTPKKHHRGSRKLEKKKKR
ncbi:hypothetical protein PVAND_011736 [Polypedilum vanderplanki]|uniref:Protein anon-73B1 n=1 Tax=Polypedilum vanderplanki TaxID=319348 RepID=A0A9J6CKK0_POLVA|nr:hypothetical protein PVAND_011736 [Polypedilum vanderplanki]